MSELSPESVPEPLKKFFDAGILTPEQVNIYVEYGYNKTRADELEPTSCSPRSTRNYRGVARTWY